MQGDWEDWGACEAQCDVGRRARRRPFLKDDVKHYTADLENQVFMLQAGNERIEQEKNTLLLNVTNLHRKIQLLEEGGKALQARVERESASKEKLQANVSQAEWQRTQMEVTVSRLKQDKDALQAKADGTLQGVPAPLGFKNTARGGDQVTTLSAVALLTFSAALGVTCACCSSGAWQRIMQRRRHRAQGGIGDPLDIAAANADDSKDIEEQQWRPVALNSPTPSDGQPNGPDGAE